MVFFRFSWNSEGCATVPVYSKGPWGYPSRHSPVWVVSFTLSPNTIPSILWSNDSVLEPIVSQASLEPPLHFLLLKVNFAFLETEVEDLLAVCRECPCQESPTCQAPLQTDSQTAGSHPLRPFKNASRSYLLSPILFPECCKSSQKTPRLPESPHSLIVQVQVTKGAIKCIWGIMPDASFILQMPTKRLLLAGNCSSTRWDHGQLLVGKPA